MQYNFSTTVLHERFLSISKSLFSFKDELKYMKADDPYYQFYQGKVAELENKLLELDAACKILNEATG